ncbi:hypothetical protein K1719_034842 [Acacia pycnantha]|nr:hypothetical protein K1719_034842 [Acacia pycnantha]
MTAPVITEVEPSDRPFCEFSFVVSLCTRKFDGLVKDSNVGEEAASLNASIAGTMWASAIEKSHRAGNASVYTVAQYNDPLDYDNRVNEIWFLFDLENVRLSI